MDIFASVKKKLSICFSQSEIDEMFENEDAPIFNIKEISLTQKQKGVIANIEAKKHDWLIFHGARRSGKTFLALYLFVDYILKSPPHSMFIASGNTIRTITMNLIQMLRKLGFSDYSHNRQVNVIKIDDKEICLVGADNKKSFAKIRGSEATGWYANEVTLQDEEMIGECYGRLSDVSGRLVVWDCNPSHPIHFIYQNYILKADKIGAYEVSWQTIDNIDNLPPAYIDDQSKVLSERNRQLYIEGKWVGDGDLPFNCVSSVYSDYRWILKFDRPRIAFLDPATGATESCSNSALTIMYFDDRMNYNRSYIVFKGWCFNGLWTTHAQKMVEILKEHDVATFFYENNLIGEGALEQNVVFQKFYISGGNIASIRNVTNKKDRICSLITPLEKKILVASDTCDREYLDNIKYASFSKDSNIKMDAIDSLESCYRVFTDRIDFTIDYANDDKNEKARDFVK